MKYFRNQSYILIMILYSVITFFLGPMATFAMDTGPDHIVHGFAAGFVVSVILWMTFGKKCVQQNKCSFY